jgi:RNA polymerase sigma-70 factor (ECF subfamily)
MHTIAAFRQDACQDEVYVEVGREVGRGGAAAGERPDSTRPDWNALVAERPYLVRFARRRLLDPALAEDLVHDVFEAVASGRAAFAGRSTLRSWLTGILKHKIVDLVRQRSGHDSLDAGHAAEGEEEMVLELECPQPRPDEVAEQRERLALTLERLRALPENLRRAVQLRLIDDEDSDDVCRELGISAGNLFVRLHRARGMLAAA